MDQKRYIEKVTLGKIRQQPKIQLQPYDPSWVTSYLEEEQKIQQALQQKALLIEHVGSTAIPKLSAKPIIDILLLVKDSSIESLYLPELVASGYVLRIREPEWYEHRMFYSKVKEVHLHVFSLSCTEEKNMLNFRNWLRSNEKDRLKYELAKQKLAAQQWLTVQEYADAKTPVITEIKKHASQFFSEENKTDSFRLRTTDQ